MEPSRRRSNLEVISDILRLGEASKTQIMYSGNMSYSQVQRYLQLLTERGFLERIVKPNPGVKYRVTQKGHALLVSIESVLNMLGE